MILENCERNDKKFALPSKLEDKEVLAEGLAIDQVIASSSGRFRSKFCSERTNI